jgi:hypothetical protein
MHRWWQGSTGMVRRGRARRLMAGASMVLTAGAVAFAVPGRALSGAFAAAGPDDRALIQQVMAEPLPADPGPDVGGRALQEQVFADGVVTFDEYRRAVLAAVECVRAEGFQVAGPFRFPEPGAVLAVEPGVDPGLRLSWTVTVRDAGEDQRLSEVDARCQSQWSYRIEQVWLRKHAPTQEEVQAWLERAWGCARERGLPLSDPPTEVDALDAVSFGCHPWEAVS